MLSERHRFDIFKTENCFRPSNVGSDDWANMIILGHEMWAISSDLSKSNHVSKVETGPLISTEGPNDLVHEGTRRGETARLPANRGPAAHQSSSATPSNTSRALSCAMLLRPRPSLLTQALAPPPFFRRTIVPVRRTLSATAAEAAGTASAGDGAPPRKTARKTAPPPPRELVRTALFLPPGVARDAEVPAEAVIPGSNIVVGPYAGDAKVKGAEYVKSSASARDCPKDDRPEFAVLGRSNVGKSSLINALTRRKEAALTSKKPGNPAHLCSSTSASTSTSELVTNLSMSSRLLYRDYCSSEVVAYPLVLRQTDSLWWPRFSM